MGIAGFAMLGAIYFLFQSIRFGVKFLVCKSKCIRTTGKIVSLQKVEPIYKNASSEKIIGTKYSYSLVVDNQGNYVSVDFCDEVSEDKQSSYSEDSILDVFYNDKKNSVVCVKALTKQMGMSFLLFIVCTVVLIVCAIIAVSI